MKKKSTKTNAATTIEGTALAPSNATPEKVQAFLNGTCGATMDTAERVAALLGKDVADLIGPAEWRPGEEARYSVARRLDRVHELVAAVVRTSGREDAHTLRNALFILEDARDDLLALDDAAVDRKEAPHAPR